MLLLFVVCFVIARVVPDTGVQLAEGPHPHPGPARPTYPGSVSDQPLHQCKGQCHCGRGAQWLEVGRGLVLKGVGFSAGRG